MPSALTNARAIALLAPAALLAGAWTAQLGFGLPPCEMCHWQRWPHYAALLPAIGAFFLLSKIQRAAIVVAALLIAASGVVGVFHAGVEYDWWEGLTRCTAPVAATLEDLLDTPLIRCDVAPWTLWGVSLAGFNAIFSLGAAAAIALLLRTGRTRP